MFRRLRIRIAQPRTTARVAVIAALCGGLVLALGGTAPAQIRDSAHDFSSSGTGGNWGSTNTNQVCIFCHIPHRALTTEVLWNRTLPTGPFSVYSNDSLDAVVGEPLEASKRCLSCHDGSVAIDAFNAGRTWGPAMPSIGDIYYPGSPYGWAGPNIGGNFGGVTANDLTDDHPVSFTYDMALVALDDNMLVDPGTIDLPLFDGRLECSTCHDVHNNSGGLPYLLRITPDQSLICRECHIK